MKILKLYDCVIISRHAGYRIQADPSPHPSPLGYQSNEASPQTDQWSGEFPTRRGLSGVSGLQRFVRPGRFAANLFSGTLRLPRDQLATVLGMKPSVNVRDLLED